MDLKELFTPKTTGEKKFVAKHPVKKTADVAGNKDDIYNASNVKRANNHGRGSVEADEKVYESAVPLHEISKNSLKSYLTGTKKTIGAVGDLAARTAIQTHLASRYPNDTKDKLPVNKENKRGIKNRIKGINTAVDKLTREKEVSEDTEVIDEAMSSKKVAGKLAARMNDKLDKRQHELLGRKADINNKQDQTTLHGDKEYNRKNKIYTRAFMKKEGYPLKKDIKEDTRELTEGVKTSDLKYLKKSMEHTENINKMLKKIHSKGDFCYLAKNVARQLEDLHDMLDNHANPDLHHKGHTDTYPTVARY